MWSGWFTRSRYGSPGRVIGSIAAFGVLFAFAVYTIADSSSLMSNNCFDDTGQITCAANGPAWARPLPGASALIGLLSSVIGPLAGRPVRTPALVAGFLLTTVGLAVSRLMQ